MSQVIQWLIEDGFLLKKGPVSLDLFENLTEEQLQDLRSRGVTRVKDADGISYEIRVPVSRIGRLSDNDITVLELSKTALGLRR
jgi:hypothetical protein